MLRLRQVHSAALWLNMALLLVLLCPACQGAAPPRQATLALTGDFRGFQRPCG